MIYILFIFGLVFGSFYNVVIYRLPEGKSVVTPRSSCGACGHPLSGLDMIPVFSYLIFSGKCRHCGQSYSPRYMVVELLTGVLFAVSYFRFGYTLDLLFGIVFSSILIIITFIDIDHHIIYDRFSLMLIILAIAYQYYLGDLTLLEMGLGFLIGGGFLLIIAIIGTMGGGDIKIMASMGLLLGPLYIGLSLYLGFIIGALVLLPFVLYQKKKYGKYESIVPFGPFLCIGAWISFYYGHAIIKLYFSFFV